MPQPFPWLLNHVLPTVAASQPEREPCRSGTPGKAHAWQLLGVGGSVFADQKVVLEKPPRLLVLGSGGPESKADREKYVLGMLGTFALAQARVYAG